MRDRPLAYKIQRALTEENLQQALGTLARGISFLRAQALQDLSDYEALKEQARRIKEDVISNLDEYLAQLEAQIISQGGSVFFAQDGEAACAHIVELAKSRNVETIVKSKSMTSEEIALNEALEAEDLTVIETDLGERIVQLARERPSHLIGPAVHKTVEEVAQLFAQWLRLDEPPREAKALTALARRALRETFFRADMGITGVNFAVAETGTLVLIENEGNIRLSARLPKTHVAVMGLEKLVPSLDDLIVFLKLLPRTATGQKLTSYVSFLSAARGDFHLVILDNGRGSLRDDPDLRETLYCIRCGACLDSCPSYQAVGGHVYGGRAYMGGIGCAWTAGVDGLEEAAAFNELCLTCGRCTEVCPVNIDIPWLNTVIRRSVRDAHGAALAQRCFAAFERFARWGSRTAPLSNWLLQKNFARSLLQRALGLDARRRLPAFRRRTFTAQFTSRAKGVSVAPEIDRKVALFVDCFSNYFELNVAWAAVRVLERLGVKVKLAENGCCGRAALSQGAIEEARTRALLNAERLLPLLDEGYKIIIVEPSCLAALRGEYRRLLPQEDALRLREGTYEIMEYLAILQREGTLHLEEITSGVSEQAVKIVYHGHCQQKALGMNQTIVEFLGSVPGLEVEAVEVPCCGMAGSFGYKSEFYELSRHLGHRLAEQLDKYEGELVASGFSCRTQISDVTNRAVKHPIQIMEQLLGGGDGV